MHPGREPKFFEYAAVNETLDGVSADAKDARRLRSPDKHGLRVVAVHAAPIGDEISWHPVVTLPVTLLEELPLCVVCNKVSLAGKRRHAQTCSAACRKAKSRGSSGTRLREQRIANWHRALEWVNSETGNNFGLGEWVLITLDAAARQLNEQAKTNQKRESTA